MDIKTICEGLPWWGHVLVLVTVMCWEFCIGETRFGSTIRLVIITPVSTMWELLKQRGKND